MNMESNHQPWQEKGISKNARLMARVGLYLTSFMTLFWFIASVYFVIAPSPKTGDFWNDTFPYLCLAGIVAGLILITLKLFRLSSAPISFTPSYQPVKPSDLGKPIEVLFERTLGLGRAISFIESITFRSEGLEIPYSVRLKDNKFISVPYPQILKMTVKGRHIAFRISNDAYVQLIVSHINTELVTFADVKSNLLNKTLRSALKPGVSFYVSEMDGERMYRELKRYFPSTIAEFII